MSDSFLIDTPELHEALKHLEDARVILVMDGKFENLEQLGDWCPFHYTRKITAERDILKKRVQELEAIYRHTHVNIGVDGDDRCASCGLDLRDNIHTRLPNPYK